MRFAFKVGDTVMAKWPGTSLYFKAVVKNIDKEEEMADVQYEDGTEMEVPFEYVKSEARFRQQRTSKSPARRRTRSKSPARSANRPPRQKKDTTPTRQGRSTRTTRSTASSSSSEEKKVPRSPSRTTITKSQRFDKTDRESKEGYEKVTTRSYQAKLVLEKVSEESKASGDSSRMSDSKLAEARQTIENVKKMTTTKQFNYEFGGPFGVLFQYLTVPVIVIAIVTCYSKKSELLKLKLSDISQDWKSYWDITALIAVSEFLLFHAFVYALPVGRIVEGPRTYSGKKTEYRVNAFFCLVVSALAYCGLMYYQVPVVGIVYSKMLQIVATCIVLSFIFNILLQLKSYLAKSDELNPGANTGFMIYDMFMGRELHPRLGQYYHLKMLLYRPCMTAWILVNVIYLQKEFLAHQTIRPPVGIVAGVQIVYCFLVFFWNEVPSIYSFDIKNEGLGFLNLIGNLAITPFVYSCPVRFLIDHPKMRLIPLPLLIIATVTLAAGLALVLLSNSQKTAFRVNPYDPSLAALESLPPSRKGGYRLITSGLWGFVRHPNYLGEILLGLGYGLMCGFSDVLPWLYVIFVAGLLIHRSLRLEERSKDTHGYAWSQYCQRVRYRIVPYVF